MPPIFLIPLVYAGLRTVISAAVGHKVDRGIDETAALAVRQISRSIMVNFAEISVNIMVFLVIIYKAGVFVDYQTSVLLICSVYVGSLLHSSYKIIRNFKRVLIIARDYRLNIKRYMFEQLYENARLAAHEQLDRMGVLRRIVYTISSGPGADTIAMRVAAGAMPLIWKRVFSGLIAAAITVSLYIVVFRMIISPFLIQQTTHFTLVQALLWPFAFSIDFFFNTSFSNWVVSLS